MKKIAFVAVSSLLLLGCRTKEEVARVILYSTGDGTTGPGEVICSDGSVVFRPDEGALTFRLYRIEHGEAERLATKVLSSVDNSIAWISPRMREEDCEFAFATCRDGSGDSDVVTVFDSPAKVGHNQGMVSSLIPSEESLIFHYWICSNKDTSPSSAFSTSLRQLVAASNSGDVAFVAVTCANERSEQAAAGDGEGPPN